MKTGGTLTFILLLWIYVTLLPVIKAQEVKVWPEVTGYLGLDVTLLCEFIPGPQKATVSQVLWALLRPDGEKNTIIVYNMNFGLTIHKPYEEEKVGIEGLSLIIKDVNMTDAGLYSCSISTFPSGLFEVTTNLIVKEQTQRSVGVVASIVIKVILMLVIVTATTYLCFVKRNKKSRPNNIHLEEREEQVDENTSSPIYENE